MASNDPVIQLQQVNVRDWFVNEHGREPWTPLAFTVLSQWRCTGG